MPIFNFKTRGIGDLVKHEAFPHTGFAREEITVGSVAADSLPMGSLVFRAIANTPGNYALVTANTQLVGTNEFAITLGDSLGEVLPLDITAGGTGKCAAIVRDAILSDKYVFDVSVVNGYTLTTTDKTNLTHILKRQGIVLETTI